MLNLPNGISLLRAPLALLFIIENTNLRILMILLAMITDSIDGYLARRYRYTSRLGAFLDPVMDKFFVYVALSVLIYESKILPWQAATLLTRDFFLFLFVLYLGLTKTWKTFHLRAVLWGKVTTAAQFVLLILLILKLPIHNLIYYFFILLGLLAFIELLQFAKRHHTNN